MKARVVHVVNVLILFSTLGRAQLVDYDAVLKAQHRADQAAAKLFYGLAALAIFAIAWIFGQVARLRRRIPRGAIAEAFTEPPSRGAARLLKALAAIVALIAITTVCLHLYACATAPKSPDVSTPFLFVAALLWVQQYLLRQSARLSTPLADEVLATDQRAPVLFLRGFTEEEFELLDNKPWFEPHNIWTFEDAALDVFKRRGPIIGLTNPMLRGRPSAYAPLDLASTAWQEKVAGLIRSAGTIVVVVASTKGLQWEVAQLRETARIGHAIFLFPPVEAAEADKRLQWLESELGISREHLTLIASSEAKPAQLLALSIVQETPKLYLGHPDLNGYLDACEQAIKDIDTSNIKT